MLAVSLGLNVVVLIPVLVVLGMNGKAAASAWGNDTPARRILAAIYAAILLASLGLLGLQMGGDDVIAWA